MSDSQTSPTALRRPAAAMGRTSSPAALALEGRREHKKLSNPLLDRGDEKGRLACDLFYWRRTTC